MAITKFGVLLSELLDKRGMDPATLARTLAGQGYHEANENTLVEYILGTREVDPCLPRFLARALALSFEEKKALALAFTFGQGHETVLSSGKLQGDEGSEANNKDRLGQPNSSRSQRSVGCFLRVLHVPKVQGSDSKPC